MFQCIIVIRGDIRRATIRPTKCIFSAFRKGGFRAATKDDFSVAGKGNFRKAKKGRFVIGPNLVKKLIRLSRVGYCWASLHPCVGQRDGVG